MFANQPEHPSGVSLSSEELEQVAGGMYKRPLQRPITVYYDDGVSVWTSDPASTNVRPLIT
jgi:hypothetical protein